MTRYPENPIILRNEEHPTFCIPREEKGRFGKNAYPLSPTVKVPQSVTSYPLISISGT